jgi:predicted MFS family arabinose efflux permease
VLFINVPIGIAVALAAPLFLTESQPQPGRFDITGALTSTAGMTALVYGFIRAASDGWGDGLALGAFAAAIVLLGLFILNESRARQPITPLRLFADRGRAGSYLARLLLVAGMFGMFFFLTQFVQDILGFSPLRAGISFLPMTAALFAVSRLSPRLLSRFPGQGLMVTGLLPVVVGMTWLSRITPGTGYLAGVLGPMLLIGAGMGLVFVPLTIAALAGVRPEDSGAASSMVNVTQQVGGSLGLAILVTAFSTASRDAARHRLAHLAPLAQAHHVAVTGMASAFTLAAIFDVCALLVVLVIVRGKAPLTAARLVRSQRR